MRRRPAALLLTSAWLVMPSWPAQAHSSFGSLGSFYSGLLHPYLVPSHVLALVGTSLFIGQTTPDQSRVPLVLLLAAYAIGLLATLGWADMPYGEPGLLSIATLTGLLAALGDPRFRFAALPVATVSGLVLGLSSAIEGSDLRGKLLMLAGTFLGGALVALVIVAVTSLPAPLWRNIGARIVGSWTAAAAALVLALSLPRAG